MPVSKNPVGRNFTRNHRLKNIMEREREKLLSDESLKDRSQRPQYAETVSAPPKTTCTSRGPIFVV